MLDSYDDSSGLHYWRSYQYIFDSPNWLMNVLLGAVCMLIPGIGPILLLGYELEIVERLHGRGDIGYPDFDFGRFLNYLLRGLWVFLAHLLISLVVILILVVPLVVLILVVAAAMPAGGPPSPGTVVLFIFLGIFLEMVLILLLSFVTIPVILRVGLSQELDFHATSGFVRDFWKRVGKELFLAILFIAATSVVMSLVGVLLCFIGIYPVTVIMGLAQSHLIYQLYQLYLRRGGSEIPLKVEAVQS